ncbi:MAG: hypothetical protein HY660_00270 [Armatimonadetes bacterium]|nr:hypothetical protein [Armatimonadota bacterium]
MLRVLNPYAAPGVYRKAQLHCHTAASDGAFAPADLLARYRAAGYAFVVITDHERITYCETLNDREFLALPGIETRVTRWIPPLGPHLGRLLVQGVDQRPARDAQACIDATAAAGGLVVMNHPSWTGSAWTGHWSVEDLCRLRGYHLVEISGPHSHSPDDVRRWTAAVRHWGPGAAPGGIAVDDCHRADQFNVGWVMVKAADVTAVALREALRRGAFYASTGPAAEFGAGDGEVWARAAREATVHFFDGHDHLLVARPGPQARYHPHGGERFVRVEARAPDGRTAWSQPFWVLRS